MLCYSMCVCVCLGGEWLCACNAYMWHFRSFGPLNFNVLRLWDVWVFHNSNIVMTELSQFWCTHKDQFFRIAGNMWMQRNLCCLNCGVSFVREVKAMQPQSSQIFFHFFARFRLQYAPISKTFMTNFLTICFMGEIFIISFDLVILELHHKLVHGMYLP